MTQRFCLGKQPAVFDSRTLRLGAYLTAKLPAPPAAVDWGKNVKTWPMCGNDQYGDCTCAAAAHMIENWTAAAGKERSPSNAQVMKFYEHFTTPGPENGCNLLSVLKYWRASGLGGDKIAAFAALEPRNATEVKDAISIFGGCYIGLALPKFAAVAAQQGKNVPWVVPPQVPVGNAAPDRNAGHCVSAVGYDGRNVYVATWGAVKAMTWAFYDAYADEAYAVLSDDFLAKNKTPDGFDMAQLRRDLADLAKIPAAHGTLLAGNW